MHLPEIPLQSILPLLSAVIYVAGTLFLKRAAQLGASAWRMVWLSNLATAAAFAPLLLLGGTMPPIRLWWQPAAVAILFILGQLFTFRSLEVGDVSVATPVLGVKIILVALLTAVILREALTPTLWAAAALSTAAIALLNLTRAQSHHHVGRTIILAGLAAASYATFDVLVQKWSPAWGKGRFLPMMMGFVLVYTFATRWGGRSRQAVTPPPARPWLAAGAACLAIQGAMFVSAIAFFRQATVANVLYSTRGLWSVVGVWLIGHWFMNREQHLGARILAARLCGAALMLIAVLLVLLRGRG